MLWFLPTFLRYVHNQFEIGAGVYDIGNEGQKFIQAYTGGHAVMPGFARE
jgi:hypothetical protein